MFRSGWGGIAIGLDQTPIKTHGGLGVKSCVINPSDVGSGLGTCSCFGRSTRTGYPISQKGTVFARVKKNVRDGSTPLSGGPAVPRSYGFRTGIDVLRSAPFRFFFFRVRGRVVYFPNKLGVDRGYPDVVYSGR